MYVSTMRARNIASDSKSESRGASFRITRLVEPVEGPKYRLACAFFNPRSVIIDCNFGDIFPFACSNPDMRAIAISVRD